MSDVKPVEIASLTLGEETFRLRWDFGAMAVWRQHGGADAAKGIITEGNMLAALYAAISADARARDVEPPITIGRLGSLLDDGVKVERAFQLLNEQIGAYDARTEAARNGAGKGARRARKTTGSTGPTSSAQSTSESTSASSGG